MKGDVDLEELCRLNYSRGLAADLVIAIINGWTSLTQLGPRWDASK